MMAFINALRPHADVVFSLGLAVLMLFALDWRLGRAFSNHELKEEKLHANTVLLADTAAATAREAGRHIDELRAETNALRLDINNLSELVRVHEAKIVNVEARILRASLAVPHRHQREGDP
jgi:ribosomal protein L13E